VQTCRKCGEKSPEGANFCPACGTALNREPAQAREARKPVTVVFADVAGSTRLGEQLDPESLRRIMSRYFETASEALQRHGATVEKFIGDAVMAVFGVPAVHEDDALRAVRAAVEMREAVEALNSELERERGVRIQIRTGVNSGEVVAGEPSDGQMLVTGDAVNVAARLEQAAGPGEILIGEKTRQLVRDAVRVDPVGSLAVKGKESGVLAWRLVEVLDHAPPLARRLDSPLIGRERELAQLRQAFGHAFEERRIYLFTVLGVAGIGKSRLAAELTATVSDAADIVVGRCLPYGEGITFWPLVEIVRDLIGEAEDPRSAIAEVVADEDDADMIAERIAAALGRSESAASAEETFWAVGKLFAALARVRPLVVVLEDIHWGEPTFLDMIEHVAEWQRDAPILLLCLARPELLEKRPDWGGGKLNATSILLGPLTDVEASALIEHLVRDSEASPSARRRIAEAAEGNPLFVEQMLAMVAEGAPSGDELEIPPTIQALLVARLDRLSAAERAVVERASVIGKRFWAGAVADLSPERDRPAVDENLQLLVRKDLIRPDRPIIAGEAGYAFRHLLIRDAAYGGIPKAIRADLHERFAGWIDERAGKRLTEVEEIVGYHFERAFQCKRELGPLDERAQDLGVRAGEHLAAAGRRALSRGDASGAVNLLGRAASLIPREARGREELLGALGAALVVAGEFARAEAVLTEAIEAGIAAENRRLELHARFERAFLRALTDPRENVEELRRFAEEAIPELEKLGDDLGLAKAWRRIGDAHWMMNQWNEQERALERALAHADRAGDGREAAGALMRLPMAIYYGPTPVPEAIERAEKVIERASGMRAVESTALAGLGGLNAMCGEFETARALIARARAISDELGFRVWVAGFSLIAGDIEMLADDPRAAEAELRSGYEELEKMGDRGLLSRVAAELARALYAQARYSDAERYATTSKELAGNADIASQISWRAIHGKVLARRSEFEAAETLCREAVHVAEQTDGLNSRARAFMDLAEVLDLADRADEGVPVVQRAIHLFDRKRNAVSARTARFFLTELEARVTTPFPG
jgi:class 3 adenylate cyclase/tetratricopeptide (TPR) repeat protein